MIFEITVKNRTSKTFVVIEQKANSKDEAIKEVNKLILADWDIIATDIKDEQQATIKQPLAAID